MSVYVVHIFEMIDIYDRKTEGSPKGLTFFLSLFQFQLHVSSIRKLGKIIEENHAFKFADSPFGLVFRRYDAKYFHGSNNLPLALDGCYTHTNGNPVASLVVQEQMLLSATSIEQRFCKWATGMAQALARDVN